MAEIFSDIFACRENRLTRIDPRVKLVIAIPLILAVIMSSGIHLPLAVAVVCICTMILIRIPASLILARLVAPLGIVFVIVVLQTFMTSGHPIFAFEIWGYQLAATEEGLQRGILIGSRVIGAVSVVLLLSSVSPAHKIFEALRWFRVPETWVEMALLVYRYIFVLIDQAADVAAAQRSRLGYSSLRRSFSSLGILAGTVVTRSLDQSLRTYEAMVLRGYQGEYRFGRFPEMSTFDRRLMLAGPLLVVALYIVFEWCTR
ncbi:cobalt ECF transporter T component CbiQ [Thermodesulfobacteriota bacterium]